MDVDRIDNNESANISVQKSCVEMQSSELMVLQSIYPELNIARFDDVAFGEIDPESQNASSVDLELNILIDGDATSKDSRKLSLSFSLPLTYPVLQKPSVFLRCESFTRASQTLASGLVRAFIDSLPFNGPMILDILHFIRDDLPAELDNVEGNNKPQTGDNQRHQRKVGNMNCDFNSKNSTGAQKQDGFHRYWIKSHHIYSATKRKNLPQHANDLSLSGFFIAGKPGVICVEGLEDDCAAFWEEIRHWPWKRITLAHVEKFPLATDPARRDGQLQELRKFNKFREESFEQKSRVSYQMSELQDFLKQRGCNETIFMIIFGLD